MQRPRNCRNVSDLLRQIIRDQLRQKSLQHPQTLRVTIFNEFIYQNHLIFTKKGCHQSNNGAQRLKGMKTGD